MPPTAPTTLTCEACGDEFAEAAAGSSRDEESTDHCPECGRELQNQIALERAGS